MADPLDAALHGPYLPTLMRLGLAVGTGVFVGLEREHHGKAGARTFAFAALIGCLGGMLGDALSLLSVALVGMLVAFLNFRQFRQHRTLALTTSAALLIVSLAGVLCGRGLTFAPVAVTVITAALLAWKQPISGFVTGLNERELRSAILLALLSFVVYPVLPEHAVDPWGVVEPRSSWATVILIAALGFVNYVLWKLYGARGAEITGFLGGLVNSTAAVAELAGRMRQTADERLSGAVYRGVMLATSAMILRNAVLLGLLAAQALTFAVLPLTVMLGGSVLLSRLAPKPRPAAAAAAKPLADGEEEADGSQAVALPELRLESPFSLKSALKFGVFFLLLQVAGTLAQRSLGTLGFYAVSFAGGLFSSASAVASAAALAAHGQLGEEVAANGAVLASVTSALVNLPLVGRVGGHSPLTLRLGWALLTVGALGLAVMAAQSVLK